MIVKWLQDHFSISKVFATEPHLMLDTPFIVQYNSDAIIDHDHYRNLISFLRTFSVK